jgi:hypothetical protein
VDTQRTIQTCVLNLRRNPRAGDHRMVPLSSRCFPGVGVSNQSLPLIAVVEPHPQGPHPSGQRGTGSAWKHWRIYSGPGSVRMTLLAGLPRLRPSPSARQIGAIRPASINGEPGRLSATRPGKHAGTASGSGPPEARLQAGPQFREAGVVRCDRPGDRPVSGCARPPYCTRCSATSRPGKRSHPP